MGHVALPDVLCHVALEAPGEIDVRLSPPLRAD